MVSTALMKRSCLVSSLQIVATPLDFCCQGFELCRRNVQPGRNKEVKDLFGGGEEEALKTNSFLSNYIHFLMALSVCLVLLSGKILSN